MTDDQQLSMGLPSPQDLTTVGDYQFEPIKGYPMLHWKGKRPFISTQYYPAQLKEVHGEAVEGWRNKIYWGDNSQVMSHLLKEFRGKVNLVYIDPPFDSKADYKKRIQLQGQSITNDQNSFEEKQYTDIWTNDEYLQFMYERLILIRELLADNGSVYLHCDYKKSHHLYCLLEEVFGSTNYKNEIVWKRTTARSDSNTYNHIHDTVIFFSKSSELIWNTQYTPYSEEYLKSNFKLDENGRLYRETPLTAPGLRAGLSGQTWKGVDPSSIGKGRHWAIPNFVKENLSEEALNNTTKALDELDLMGRIKWAKEGAGRPNIIQYSDDLEGVELQSIWTEFSALAGNSIEAESYPTQKPEALLERIIKASSSENDLVLDCFMGSGTTQAVAMKLGRRFVGADINLGAVQITTKRLLGVAAELEQQQGKLQIDDEASTTYYTGFETYNVNYYDVFRNPAQAKDLLIEALEINPLERSSLFDGEKDGRLWKIMPVNRITSRADLNELIAGFNYKAFEKRYQEYPHKAVEKITLVCMGHDPDLASVLKQEIKPFELDVEVFDILRDKQEIQFKRDSEAQISIKGNKLVIETFYPMNLLAKLSLQQENVEDWRELVESVMIDWNYDGAILEPKQVDIPSKNELVKGSYSIPDDAGTIRIKITDLLSESLEIEVQHG